MYKYYIKILSLVLWLSTPLCQALTFSLQPNSSLIGQSQEVTSIYNEPITDIGKNYNIGVYEMIEANPHLDPWEPPSGSTVLIPSHFILPSGPKTGLVINLAEMRLYFYHPDGQSVTTFPISVGKPGWPTPLGTTQIVKKVANPTWYIPASIRAVHLKHGRKLPVSVPPGPTNPLGKYALYLGLSAYLIHGIITEGGIGMRNTHGCISLYPEDIAWLYKHVPQGSLVRIVHEDVKIGIDTHNMLHIEAHLPLREALYIPNTDQKALIQKTANHLTRKKVFLPWKKIKHVIQRSNGVPEPIESRPFS
jgi:L,D-transpeptidase ErfK/SrfK